MQVSLMSQHLQTLPELNLEPEAVTELNIFNNQFTDFPQEALSFVNLHTLNISANKITTIPDAIG